jgi:hypothetical protein
MQILGVISFLLAIVAMYLIYVQNMSAARFIFASALFTFIVSLSLSLLELLSSTKSLEIELSDMEDLDDPNILEYLRSKLK